MTQTVFILLVVFQFKHLLADYYLQFPYMYMNKGKKTGWAIPLLHHSLIHAGFTLAIVITFGITINFNFLSAVRADLLIAYIVLIDGMTHFMIDRWKAIKTETPDEPEFWHNLGVDQMVHHTVGIIIVYLITRGGV